MLTHELVARQAASSPEAIAVVDGSLTLTYAELDRRANRWAHLMIRRGAGPTAPVAVCLPRRVDLAVVLLACWKAGAAYVPLDPSHPADRVAAVLDDARPALVVADRSTEELVGARALLVDKVGNRLPDHAPDVPVSGEHPAYVVHTSGSTGTPKGVVVPHSGIGNRIAWVVAEHGLGPADRVLQKTSLAFDAACWEFFAPLVGGGTVVLAPQDAHRDPAAVVRAVADHGITVLQVVPSVLRALVEERGWERCGSLRLLFSAGEQLHADLVQRFLDVAGDVEVVNTYGPTECSIDVTAHVFDPVQASGPVAIGRPISGMRVAVVDAGGADVAPGDEGELCASGVGVAQGYLGRPALTAEVFVPDPSGPPGTRRYRTGDRVRLRADGELEYVGRLDDQVKINGVRVEPAEVELALMAHPAVLEAAVTVFPSASGSARLAAHVRLRPGSAPGDLRSFLAQRMPSSHLPSVFAEVDDFPRTSSGKVDRTALATPPEHRRTAVLTDQEHLVAGAWRNLLGVEAVSPEDDFFRLGGSSLQLTQLANRLSELTGREVPLPALLAGPTVAEQARLLADAGSTAAPIARVPREGGVPLSFGQHRLWLLDQIKTSGREWVSGHFLRVPAGFREADVRRALDLLVARHESLRTTFTVRDGEPVQVVGPVGRMDVRVFDVPRAEVGAVVDREATLGFDLATGPLSRALLFPAERGERTVVLLMHHIICDGWSAAVLERDFAAALRGDRLPEPAVQYADFSVWQRERLTAEVLHDELEHWRGVLAGATATALRTDRPRPPVRDVRGAVVEFTVPADVADSLAELGRRAEATPFMTLLTSFAVLLARCTDEWDVVLGAPVAGRGRPEVEDVVGFFLNSLVLRCPLDGDMSFTEALDTVRDTCREAFAHQDLPFEQLVAALAPGRDPSRTPMYQVAFDLHDEQLTGTPTGADLAALVDASTIAKTDLTLYLRKRPDGGLHGVFEYATALFERATVERLARHFTGLLAALAAAPGATVATADFLPDDERVLLAAWNRAPGYRLTATAPRLFEQRAAASPDAVALVAGTSTTSFAQLDQQANRLARHLRTLGAGPESVVGVLLDRGADLPAALLGAWKAGAAYLPLDPQFPSGRTALVLADAEVRVLVTQSDHAAALGDRFDGHLVLLDSHADRLAIAGEDGSAPDRSDDPDSIAYVIYTSGSTGRPKGVQVTHRGLSEHLRWAVDELVADRPGGAPLLSSVAFDLVVPNLWAPLLAGRPLHLLPADLDLARLGEHLVAAAPFSFIKLTPGHLEILTHQVPPDRRADLADVVVVAGEALPPALAAAWAGRTRLVNEYGPTETTVGACTHPVAPSPAATSVPIGSPLPGVSMHVLDPAMNAVPVGVAGELHIGGEGVARAYANQPALTAAQFVPDPWGVPGARLYRTGDVVRLVPDGNGLAADFLGRRDEQVKIRGHRVEPGEIAAVVREHPSVRDAVVVVRDEVLRAYWVAGGPADDEALRAWCAERVPAHMVPAGFTEVASMPLTANGKVDRAALPEPAAVVVPVAPGSLVEERIAVIFAELLGTDAGVHSDFFAAGGNSILAIRLIAAIQSAFDVDLPIRAVFEGATVAGLATAVEEAVRADVDRTSFEEMVQEGGTT